MEKKTQDFSVKEAQRLANSPEGRQLMEFLQQQNSGQLQKAMEQAAAGNYKEAGALLQALTASPEARQLIRQLGKRHG